MFLLLLLLLLLLLHQQLLKAIGRATRCCWIAKDAHGRHGCSW